MNKKKITYKSSGINYSSMDPLKKLAQLRARETASNHAALGFSEVSASRGESAYVWEEEDSYRAFVVEGLGTKNLVADVMRSITGKTYYDSIAQDTVAMIVNDLIVVGAAPQVVNAYFAAGSSEWFADEERVSDLVNGWARACNLAGAVWGGGETPTQKGIISDTTIDLAGSAVGMIKPKNHLVLGDKLASGDRILLIESNGIHANGLTLARAIVHRLSEGYATKLTDGTMYGESLLRPTRIYAELVKDLFDAGIAPHYMVNVTGHGWRKMMRATQEFRYIIETIPDPDPLFQFLQEHSGNNDQEMYGTFNMGVGFAVMLSEKDMKKALEITTEHELMGIDGGYIEKGKKEVVIQPKNITFTAESLDLR